MIGDTARVDAPAARMQRDALRFLRRFGLVAAAWVTLLAAAAPTVARPAVLWAGVAVVWAWAVASQAVPDPRRWWAGWLVVAIVAELLGPLADTDGWTVVGGVSFVVLAGAAVSGRRRTVVATVVVLSAVAVARGVVAPGWNVAGGVGTVMIFAFGGLALAWVVRAVEAGQAERERLAAQVAEAELRQAVLREREEAAARLHDSVLQTLTAIERRSEGDEARVLAAQAGEELRAFLRRPRSGRGGASLRTLLDREVIAAAGGRRLTFGAAGDAPVDDRSELLVAAAVEAVRNAVAHTAGAVRVFLEAGDDALTVWVSDQGDGFDPAAVPVERLGIRESIVGRLERAGGTATVRAGPEGSEWTLRVPRR